MSCAWAVGGQLLPPTQSGTRAYHERAPNGKFGVILSPNALERRTSTRFITSPKVVPRRSPRRAHLGRRTRSLSHDVEAAATRPGGGHEHHHLPVCDI